MNGIDALSCNENVRLLTFLFPSSSVTSLFSLIEWSVHRGLAPQSL